MAKWIITGGAGFIGCHAAARLHRQGHDVVLVDNLSRRGADENLAWLRQQGVTRFVRADVRDAAQMREILARNVDADAVLHLAAQVAVSTSVVDPRTDFEINALGTFNVLEAVRVAAKARPVVLYSSTNKVYGGMESVEVVERDGRYAYRDLPQGVDEEQPLDFHSPYGCSKGTGDQYIRDYARIYGLRTVTFRQSCIYGTRQFGIEDQGWIAWFCVAVVTSQPFSIFGDGKQIRDTLWVDDLVDAYQAAYERIDSVSGEVFNVGGGPANTLSLRELVARLEREFGRTLDPAYGDWRPGDQRVFVANIRKAERQLGWKPRVSTTEGVGRLIDWVRDNVHLFDRSRPVGTRAVAHPPHSSAGATAPALKRGCDDPNSNRLPASSVTRSN